MKRCSRCKEEKDESEFQRNSSAKDGLQDQCRACRRETDRQIYLKRSEEQKERYNEWNRQNSARNIRKAYEYLREHPCVDCGETDPIVLEFDHVNGEKHAEIANMLRSGRTWERIWEEVQKCEVRCANCHRRITARRQGTWKYIWSLEDTPT
jgi:hypothetical protein